MTFIRTLSLLFLVIFSMSSLAGSPLKVGNKAPNWILPDANGRHVSFYEHCSGQTAIILFWATWCPYCSALMPELEKLRMESAGKAVKFYALNIWEDGDPVQHMKTHNYGSKLLLNADNVAKRYGVKGTPGLFVIAPDKTVQFIRAKGQSPADVMKQVRKTLTKIGMSYQGRKT